MPLRLSLSVICLLADACAPTPVPRNPFLRAPTATARGHQELPTPSDPEAPERLVNSVVLLDSSPDDLAPTMVGRAVRAVSVTLQPLSSRSALDAQRVAARIEAASPSSLAHVALAKKGLEVALQALLALPAPDGRRDEYKDALQGLDTAIQNLREVVPLSDERAAIGAAFRAAADALFVALDRERPFRTPAAARDHEPLPVELEVDRSRAAILELARARWTDGREATSRALSALADLLAAAESTRNAPSAQVKELRFQAKRLGRSEDPSFHAAAGVKKALGAALDGLERRIGDAGPATSDWTRAARRAVDSIEERSTITLQRAAIQDALRATIDAFASESSGGVRVPESMLRERWGGASRSVTGAADAVQKPPERQALDQD